MVLFDRHREGMPHFIDALAAGPWVLVLVFAVSGLDAVLPFMPSESTVVAVGVLAATTGRPNLGLLIAAAAAGAFAGDLLSYMAGRRSNSAVAARTTRGHRAQAVHDWVHRLLHSHGGLVIVFARYIPGGRSTTAFAAGVVHYPGNRFRWYTTLAVLIWATETAVLGYLGGTLFADRPLVGLALGWTGALAISGLAVAVNRIRRPSRSDIRLRTAPSPRGQLRGAVRRRVRFLLSDLRDERRCRPVVASGGRLVWVG
jgi:membrane protein DedA with SNARE-associated domain